MILKSLILDNFLAHEETKLEFADNGITVLIGDNGAGKSSILEAILFALYGSSSKGNISQLVKWGKRKAKIELEFSKNSDDYKIEREITLTGKSHSQTAVVYKKEKGNYRLYYTKNINKELPKITGITQKTFLNSILVKQGDIEGLLELTPKKRAEVFEELLDMSLYQILSEKFGEKRKQIEKEVNAVLSSLPDEEEIKNQLLQLKKEKESIEKKVNALKGEKEILEKSLKSEKDRLKELQKEKEENLKLLANIKTLEERQKQIKNQIKDKKEILEKIKAKEKEFPNLEKEYKSLKEKEKLLKELLEVKSIKEKLLKFLEKEKEYEERKSIYEKYKDLSQKYEEYKNKIKELNDKVNELSKYKGEINSLENQLEKIKLSLKETQKKALEITNELIKIKKIFKTLQLNPTIINTMIQDENKILENYQEQREELISDYRSKKERIEEIKKQLENISNLEGECPTCARPLNQHSKEEIIKDLRKDLEKLSKKLKEVEEKGKGIKEKINTEKEIIKLLEQFKNWYEKHKEAKKNKEDIQSQIRVRLIKIKELEKIEEEKKDLEKFLKENEEKYQIFIETERYLKNTDINSIKKEIKDLKEKVARFSKEVKQEELEEEIKNLKHIEEKYLKTKQKIEEKGSIEEEIQGLKEETEKISQKLENLKQKIKDEKEIDKNIKEIYEEIQKIEESIKIIDEKLNPEISKYGFISGQINTFESQLQSLKENMRKINKKKQDIEKYRKLENALGPKGIQKVIRDSALYQLPILTGKLFKAFGFDFNQVKFSENFDIFVQVLTYERKDRFIPVSAISGGQKVALGLALRIALSHFLGNRSEFLILDEPTVHLDSQRKEELINILLKLKEKNFVKQMIVVTHDREIEDAADQIYYIEKGKVREIA